MIARPAWMLCLLLPATCFSAQPEVQDPKTALTGPLAQYVAAPDASYGWVKRSEGSVLGCKYVELTLTSQTWRGIVWKHQLFVLKPSEINPQSRHAVLLIGGGNWKDELADPKTELKLPREAQLLAVAAQQMKSPVAILLHVPQQPIFDGKREDAIIAMTFEEFLKTGDATWPLLAPMVKSAVRGMDAVTEAARQEWNLDVEKFTVTGASKRGWTTWLTGAVDSRVAAIAPMVIDMLNMSPQVVLQRQSFGELSEKVDDYKQRQLDRFIDTPRGVALRKIVDPFEYRSRITQPKLIILGTNDRYWPLDAASLYWDELVGEKYLLYIPNNGHGLTDYGRITASLNALHQSVVSGKPLPKLSWVTKESDEKLLLGIESNTPISQARQWSAAAKTRDFRDAVWTARGLLPNSDRDKVAGSLDRPTDGFAAAFVELVFNASLPDEFSLTTNVKIVPAAPMASGR